MLAASFLMGGPPVFAAYGLGEALCFHLGGGAKVTGMALIHHNREALGQSFYGVFSPQQRRAAAFTFGKSANGSDYSSKNPHAPFFAARGLCPSAREHHLGTGTGGGREGSP